MNRELVKVKVVRLDDAMHAAVSTLALRRYEGNVSQAIRACIRFALAAQGYEALAASCSTTMEDGTDVE